MAKYIVSTLDEIPPGERKIVEVEGRSVGVFNIAGEFFSLRNQCPHQGGPLCQGRLSGLLKSRVPGEYRYTRKGEILRCPWHGWEFDVKTGQSWWNPARIRARSYKVSVEIAPNEDAEAAMPGLEKGPYTAETYPVSVKQQRVFVEIP